MNFKSIFFAFSCLTVLFFSQINSEESTNNQPKFVNVKDIQWVGHPALPKDFLVSAVYGNPKKNELFALRLKAPAGSKIPPHWHPIDENITVLSGSLNLGMGEEFKKEKTVEFPTGSFVHMPAKHPHYVWFKEETIVQINDVGPWDIIYINPKDDPRKS